MHETTNGNWTLRTTATLFGSELLTAYVLSGDDLFNPVVLTEIELPTGQKYKFSYDIYGRIEKMSYPTGGEEKFVYGVVPPLSESPHQNISDQANFGVVNRKVSPVPNGSFYEWNYGAVHIAPAGYKVSITPPDGTLSERIVHRGNDPCRDCEQGNFGFDTILAGMPYEESSFDASSPRKLLSRKLTSWTRTSFTTGGTGVPPGTRAPCRKSRGYTMQPETAYRQPRRLNTKAI